MTRAPLALVPLLLLGLAACSDGGPSGAPLPNPFASWQYHCRAPLQSGDACDGDQACAPGLHCSPATKRCAPPGGRGAPCATDRGCTSDLACKGGLEPDLCYTLRCDANGNNCQQDRPTSTPCGLGATCPANHVCVGGNPLPSVCADRAPPGARCDTYAGNGCVAGHVCRLGDAVCIAIPGAGQTCGMPMGFQACASGLACRALTSGENLCSAPLGIGARCVASSGECGPGAHCNLRTLVCDANRRVGDDCQNGNECGEPLFDRQNGRECVQGECVDTTREGAKCWPNDPSQCTNGRVCRKS